MPVLSYAPAARVAGVDGGRARGGTCALADSATAAPLRNLLPGDGHHRSGDHGPTASVTTDMNRPVTVFRDIRLG